MTKKELNRDIKRLKKDFDKSLEIFNGYSEMDNSIKELTQDLWRNTHVPRITKEFKRLWGADKEFDYANLTSLKSMLIIQNKIKAVPEHRFLANIK
jgi:hypothetical protein